MRELSIPEPELWELVRIGEWQRVSAGTELMREGEAGEFFCLLVEGEAGIGKTT